MSTSGYRHRPAAKPVLSVRQRQVLDLLAHGRTNAQIAESLGMTMDGAKWHVSQLLAAYGVTSREELAAWWRGEKSLTRRVQRVVLPLLAGTPLAIGASVGALIVLTLVAAFIVAHRVNLDGTPSPAPPTVPDIGNGALPLAFNMPDEDILRLVDRAGLTPEAVRWYEQSTTRSGYELILHGVYRDPGRTVVFLIARPVDAPGATPMPWVEIPGGVLVDSAGVRYERFGESFGIQDVASATAKVAIQFPSLPSGANVTQLTVSFTELVGPNSSLVRDDWRFVIQMPSS